MTLPFGSFRQPDQRSCGPSCLVVARMLADPEYAGATRARFDEEVLATHRRVTGSHPAVGALQLPWPRVLGTPPWAAAREMGRITGRSYRWRLARWGREVYNPARGGVARVTRAAFTTADLGLGSWDVPWFTITP
jgi:hypothetical protein